ncbi:RagB/SusD family nutrient uptake outer membrane protein [uncultured Alistipes sp.]|uniref:RagB/SusD family nutrient uptake outer membrane protein n=1 Tax=uncultured Alistipes sp. TaxID=538949 RepID=UPI0025EC2493|nr:RagB/SusD family nutrient uptake outer membrane protein [uncultured Alistipes sp.]
MKKIVYILAAGLLAFGATSCLNDVLDVENRSENEPNVVFSNYNNSEGVIFSIYQQYAMNKSYRNRFLNYYGGNTDSEWYNSAKENDMKTNLWSYSTFATESNQMNESDGSWSIMYMAIEYANLAIEGLREYGDVQNREDMRYLLGEALTLRALYYYDLIKAWGDVPARFKPVTSGTIYIPRTDRDEIYKQIIADLQEAEDYVFWPTTAKQTMTTGRVNKAFTKGLLARVCLAAAGYSWRPDEGTIGTGNTGSNRRSKLVEAGGEWADDALYKIALQACKDVIEHEGVYYNLAENFKTIWTDMMQYKNSEVGADKEVLFVIPFGHETMRGQWNWNFAIRHQAKDDHVGVANYGGSVGPVPSMFYEYGKTDERRALTCVNFEWSASAKSVQEPAGFNKWYFGKYRYEWMADNYYVSSNDDGIMPIVMRYADVLLMAAECANELGDEGYAKDQLRKVRLRAYKSNKTPANAYIDALAGKDVIRKAIIDERGLEFCGEMLRKNDLIRWGILGKSIDDVRGKMKALASHQSYTSTITGRTYDYTTVGTNLYYRYVGDANPNTGVVEEIEMYGLDFGEAGIPEGTGWTQWSEKTDSGEINYEYIKEGKLKEERIDLISQAGDANATDQRMYWPLFSAIMGTNYALANDYGY